jgi:hypothetical protein
VADNFTARRRTVLSAMAMGLLGAPGARAEWLRDEVVVYADPPLRPVLTALAQNFHSNMRIFCAPPAQMVALLAHGTQDDVLITQPAFAPAGARAIWRNRLAIAGLGASAQPMAFTPAALSVALDGGKLAVPDSTPAATFDAAPLLALFGLSPAQIQGAASTTDALGMLRTGDAKLALCHVTEIMAEPRARIVQTLPDAAYAPIIYAAGPTKTAWSRNQQALLAALPHAPQARAYGLELLA